MGTYKEQFNIAQTEKLRQLMLELPECAFEFFRGIEHKTSVLTRIGYARDLKLFFNYIVKNSDACSVPDVMGISIDDIANISATNIEMFLEYLSCYTDANGKTKTNSLSAKNRKLACIRSFYKYFLKKGKLENNPAALVDMAKMHQKPIIRLESNEVADLLDSIETGSELQGQEKKIHDSTTAKRDLAITTLFLSTGIRVSELVGINIKDIDFENNSFKVTRKGGDEAILFFNEETKKALIDYYNERSKIETKDNDKDAFFLSIQKKRIGVRAIQLLVKKYASRTTPLKKISPHKLRSTFGTNLYHESGDIYLVADLLGHKDVNTTRKHYAAKHDEDRKRNAAKQIELR